MSKPKKNGTFYRALKHSYSKGDERKKALSAEGYEYDEGLSNHNQQVYYNPNTKKMVYSVAGTHNKSDMWTDVRMLFGGLKKTKRYKEADKRYAQAREKYNPSESTVVGHSLGGSIASGIAKKEDKIMTYNKGSTIGQKNRKNEQVYHTNGDPISMFSTKGAKRLKFTMNNPHSTSHLQDSDLSV